MTTALVLALLLGHQLPARDQKPVRSPRTASIAGRVVDAESGAPIAHAVVQVRREGPGERAVGVETGSDGDFRFSGLAPGGYRVVALPPDHRATHVSQDLNGQPTALWIDVSPPSIVLAAGDRREDLRIRLPRALAVEGQVVDEYGEPMRGVLVSAHGERVASIDSRGRETDDRGLFRVFGLRAGNYRVCATPAPNAPPTSAGRARRTPYRTTCYPSAPSGGGDLVSVNGNVQAPLTIVMQRLPGYVISGRVTSKSGSASVQLSVIRLGQAAPGVIPVSLQPGGVFRAQGLPPGQYLVHANAGSAPIPPFEPSAIERAYRIVELTTGNVAGLELVMTPGAGAMIAQDVALLPPESPPVPVSNDDPPPVAETSPSRRRFAISGRVLDEDGNPLAGITVAAMASGSGKLFTTDDRGAFRIFDLWPGRHVVCASSGQAAPFDTGVRRRSMYVSNCFPFASREADATQVTLTDHDVEGFDLRLQRHSVYAISGQIVSADGDAASVPLIQMVRLDAGSSAMYRGTIQPTGSFRLINVLPGTYFVSAQSGPSRNGAQDPQWGGVRIEVTTSDVDGVLLPLKRSVSVKGIVTFEDPPAAWPRLTVRARGAYPGPRPGSPPAALVSNDGTFELEGLFGPVVVSLQPDASSGYAVSSLRYRGNDVTDRAIEFDGGSGESVEIVLTSRTATLAGLVRASDATASAKTEIICFPADAERWAHFERCRTQVGSDGSWRLPPLVAGEYLVAALSAEDASTLVFPADYVRIADLARRVKLQPGEVSTPTLRVVTLRR